MSARLPPEATIVLHKLGTANYPVGCSSLEKIGVDYCMQFERIVLSAPPPVTWRSRVWHDRVHFQTIAEAVSLVANRLSGASAMGKKITVHFASVYYYKSCGSINEETYKDLSALL